MIATGLLLGLMSSPAISSGQSDSTSHVYLSVKQALHAIRKGLFIPITCMPLLYLWAYLAIPLVAFIVHIWVRLLKTSLTQHCAQHLPVL